MASEHRESVVRPAVRGAVTAPFIRLLTWYECAAFVRGIVLRVPGNAGAALDAAFLAALAMMRRGSVE
jgi:hypothetical protein